MEFSKPQKRIFSRVLIFTQAIQIISLEKKYVIKNISKNRLTTKHDLISEQK